MSRRLRGKLSLHVEEFKKLDMVKKSNLPNMPGRPKHSIIVNSCQGTEQMAWQ